MATGLSITLRQQQMDFIFGGAAATAPTTIALGLKTADPSDDNSTGTEPSSTGSYGRVSTTSGTTNYLASTSAAGSPALVGNKTAVNFPTSTAAWSTGATALTYAILMSTTTLGSGTYYGRALLTAGQTVNATGITLSFAIYTGGSTGLSWTNSFT
jgi:hypothetical protein